MTLTKQETEIVRQISVGRTQAAIAKDLGITDRQVRRIIRSARGKMGATNTYEMIARASRMVEHD